MTNSGVAPGLGISARVQWPTQEPAPPSPAAMMGTKGRDGRLMVESDRPATAPAASAAHGPSPGAAQDWRPFLRALVAEIDAVAGSEGRDALLHGVGHQLARMYSLSARDSLAGLALDMTETLDGFGWGAVTIAFSESEHCLMLTHEGLPRVGGAGDPPGTWLAAVLVGLYEGWMAQQPGADESLVARRVPSAQPGQIVIRYGKA